MLAYISSDKWLRAGYGSKLRALLAQAGGMHTLIDFGDLPVFETATAYPMILVARRNGTNRSVLFARVMSLDDPYPDIDAVLSRDGQTLSREAINGANWALADGKSADLHRIISGSGVPFLEYVRGRVYYGIKTGFGRAFMLDAGEKDRLILEDSKSAEIIEPFATGKEIRPWCVADSPKWLIVTKIGVDIRRYPAILRHLSRWESELRTRDDQGKHWWELRPCTYYAEFSRPKIIYQKFQVRPCFSYDTKCIFVNDSTYIVPTDDLYLLGVLNSAPFWDEIVRHCSPIQNGYQLMRSYFGKCVIPTAAPVDRSAVADLAQKCLDAKGQGPHVAEWEAEINARVAKLYGL